MLFVNQLFFSTIIKVSQLFVSVMIVKIYLPFLVEGCGNQVGESGGLHLTAFLQRVHIHLEFHPGVEGLRISGEAGDTHEAGFVDLEDSLEVAIDGHELG